MTAYSETLAELEKAVMWAELSLANCSWQTTDSNRIKVAVARENLAKHKESKAIGDMFGVSSARVRSTTNRVVKDDAELHSDIIYFGKGKK